MSLPEQSNKSILLAALEIAAGVEREQFLKQACGENEALRAEIQSMIIAHDHPPQFIADMDQAQRAVDQIAHERPGTQIGPYRLREQIGEGGFGTVFVAQQEKPVARQVALKVIKPGMDTRAVVARFEAERQALALMDHPNIARVLDAGATELGRPYFVMELVKGTSITEFCDAQKLGTKQRLQLFVDVCRAVQHAHQKGIIHRDLKPSNVMVSMQDDRAIPKVIDFGVAKALSQKLTETTVYTRYGQLVGTPLYMSPEQAQMNEIDVDTRSDVYSLGILLYELLTGTTPFDGEAIKQANFDELRRIIREDEPLRPSDRISTLRAEQLSTVSDRRKIGAGSLARSLRGELDWIVMKALEKDRNRRYESASALAADAERYLNDEPVQARPPSVAYRLHKFVGRNRAKLAVFSCLILAFVITAGSIGWQLRNRAAQRASLVQQVKQALRTADVRQGERDWRAARTAVESAKALIPGDGNEYSLTRQVENRLAEIEMIATSERIRLSWGSAGLEGQQHIGLNAPSQNIFDDDAVDAAYTSAFREFGISVDELDTHEAATRIRIRTISDELVAALDHWALVRRSLGDYSGSQHLLAVARAADESSWRNQLRDAIASENFKHSTLAELAEAIGSDPVPASAIVRLAEVLQSAEMTDRAVEVLRSGQRKYPGDFWINARLGQYCGLLNRWEDAIRFNTAAVALRVRSPYQYARLGIALGHRASLDEAIEACREAVRLAPDSPSVHASLGFVLRLKGERSSNIRFAKQRFVAEWQEAIHEYREVRRLAPDEPHRYGSLAFLLWMQGDYEQAEVVLRDFLRAEPENSWATWILGEVRGSLGHPHESRALIEKAIELDPNWEWPYTALARLHRESQEWAELRAVLQKGIAANPKSAPLRQWLGDFYFEHTRQFSLALAEYQAAVRLWNLPLLDNPTGDSARISDVHSRIGEIFQTQGRIHEAIDHYQTAWRLWPQHTHIRDRLVEALIETNQLEKVSQVYAEAESFFRDGIRVAEVLTRQGKNSEAEAVREMAIRLNPNSLEGHISLARHLTIVAPPKPRNAQRALEAANKAVEFSPENYMAWMVLGWARYRAGDWQGSIEALQTSCELENGGNEWQWFFLAMAHWQCGNKQEASAWYDRATRYVERVQPDAEEPYRFRDEAEALMPFAAPRREAIKRAEAQHTLARSLVEQEKFAEAEEVLWEATRLDPENWIYQQFLGDVLHRVGKLPKAETAYRAAIQFGPDDAGRWHNFGDILREQDKLDEAANAYRHAISLTPTPHSHLHLAFVYRNQKNLEQAEHAARQAIRLAPKDALLHRFLGEILSDQNKQDEAEAEFLRAKELRGSDQQNPDKDGDRSEVDVPTPDTDS